MKKQLIRFLIIVLLGSLLSCTDFVAEEAPMSLSTNPTDIVTLSSEASTTTIIVRSGEEWDITSLPDWVSVSSIEKASNSIYEWEVSLYVDLNNGYNRSGEVVFSDNKNNSRVAIHQSGTSTPTHFLTFTSEGTTSITLINSGNNPILYYSYDKSNWSLWDYQVLTFSNDKPVYLCGNNKSGFSSSTGKNRFYTSGDKYRCSGDIMSIIDAEDKILRIPSSSCFASLFYDDARLLSGPDLPALILTQDCYSHMFFGCTSLTGAPVLPATSLEMSCYQKMFQNCTRLTKAPKLPAVSLAPNCYSYMFYGCLSMSTAPVLPATELVPGCYNRMFSLCSSLNYIVCLATSILSDSCVENWLYGVGTNGTFVKATNMANWPVGSSGIPEGWTIMNE